MATDQTGRTIATNEVYLVAGRVRRIESTDLLIVLGNGGTLAVRVDPADLVRVDNIVTTDGSRTLPATAVSISSADWAGALLGSGITNLQELADWLDANLTITPP